MLAGLLLAVGLLLGGVARIPTTAPVVTLTVDTPRLGTHTLPLARRLQERRIPATFFFATPVPAQQAADLRGTRDAGHTVGLLVEEPLPADPVQAILCIRRQRSELERLSRSPVLYFRATVPLSPVVAATCRNEGLIQVGFTPAAVPAPGLVLRLSGDREESLVERVERQHLHWVSMEEFLQDGWSHRAYCLAGGGS